MITPFVQQCGAATPMEAVIQPLVLLLSFNSFFEIMFLKYFFNNFKVGVP